MRVLDSSIRKQIKPNLVIGLIVIPDYELLGTFLRSPKRIQTAASMELALAPSVEMTNDDSY
jgi:hypothetical protein